MRFAGVIVITRRLATDRFRRLQRGVLEEPRKNSADAVIIDSWLDVQAPMARLSSLERTSLVLTALELCLFGHRRHPQYLTRRFESCS